MSVAVKKKSRTAEKPTTVIREDAVKAGAVKKRMKFVASNSSILDAKW